MKKYRHSFAFFIFSFLFHEYDDKRKRKIKVPRGQGDKKVCEFFDTRDTRGIEKLSSLSFIFLNSLCSYMSTKSAERYSEIGLLTNDRLYVCTLRTLSSFDKTNTLSQSSSLVYYSSRINLFLFNLYI